MSVPIGVSFGDVVAVVKIGHAIRASLCESGSSIQQVQKLASDAEAYRKSIEEVRQLYTSRSAELDETAQGLVEKIVDALRICGEAVNAFLAEIQPYRKIFEENTRPRSFRKGYSKVKFVFDKPAVIKTLGEALDAGLRLYDQNCSALEVHLLRDSISYSKQILAQQKLVIDIMRQFRSNQSDSFTRLEQNGNEVAQLLQQTVPRLLAMTEQWENQTDSGRAERSTGETGLVRRGSGMRGKRQQDLEITIAGSLLIPFSFLLALYSSLLQMLRLPEAIAHTWETWSACTKSIILEDAIGRKLIFQIEICSTLPELRRLLKCSFRERPDYWKVRNQQYKLIESQTGDEIKTMEEYEMTVVPGLRVLISMEVRLPPQKTGTKFPVCPQCRKVNYQERELPNKPFKCIRCDATIRIFDSDGTPDGVRLWTQCVRVLVVNTCGYRLL